MWFFLFCQSTTCLGLDLVDDQELIDLEEMAQEFVLQTKQIHLEEYPIAFNPSIIRFQEKLLLSFRVIPDRKDVFTSCIGLVWLDEDFNPVTRPQLLDTTCGSNIPSRSEDGRLIQVGDQLYLVYCDNRDVKITRGGFRVYVAKLDFDGATFTLQDVQALKEFEWASVNVREKNWTPFDYNGSLLLTYSMTPHRIVYPIPGSTVCETISETPNDLPWLWGIPRGGTQALSIDENHYLSFFHSSVQMPSKQSQGVPKLHYFMGAYIFEKKPPFEIIKISLDPIIGRDFYTGPTYKPYWHPVQVVFPGGFIFDTDHIWVVYGKQDHELWVAKLNKKELMKSLVEVCCTP